MNSATDKTSTYTNDTYTIKWYVHTVEEFVYLYAAAIAHTDISCIHVLYVLTDEYVLAVIVCRYTCFGFSTQNWTRLHMYEHIESIANMNSSSQVICVPTVHECTCVYTMWRKTDFCSASFPNKILFLSGPVNEVRTLDKSIYGRFNGVWSFEPCYLRFDASLSSFSTYIK